MHVYRKIKPKRERTNCGWHITISQVWVKMQWIITTTAAKESKTRLLTRTLPEGILHRYTTYEKIARSDIIFSGPQREFFANREAAQQIKARVERYERGGGGSSRAGGPRPGAGGHGAHAISRGDGHRDIDHLAGILKIVDNT